jgi:hypothetical protein
LTGQRAGASSARLDRRGALGDARRFVEEEGVAEAVAEAVAEGVAEAVAEGVAEAVAV